MRQKSDPTCYPTALTAARSRLDPPLLPCWSSPGPRSLSLLPGDLTQSCLHSISSHGNLYFQPHTVPRAQPAGWLPEVSTPKSNRHLKLTSSERASRTRPASDLLLVSTAPPTQLCKPKSWESPTTLHTCSSTPCMPGHLQVWRCHFRHHNFLLIPS